MEKNISVNFDDSIFTPDLIIGEAEKLAKTEEITVSSIFKKLLEQIEKVDFKTLADVEDDEKITNAAYRILTIQHILSIAEKNSWGLCKNQDFIYAYNGSHWSLIDPSELKTFLGDAAEKMGIKWDKARDYIFRKSLYEQFLESAHFVKPDKKDGVLIPLLNGTFEINNGLRTLRGFDKNDFLTYQLPFAYDAEATAPRFQKYLNEVLPDEKRQLVLAEFLGYLFTVGIKLEKALILFGSGSNGKSVMFDIITNLLGANNVSNYSLNSLTDVNGYYRAMIANKLVNYASEINGNLEASLFKQLVSGEPIEARLPYGQPMIIKDYAKMIFNTNTLPHDVEHTHAFFRRWLIIEFDVTIGEAQQDPELAKKIIGAELAGVFNWVLSGLDRILASRSFTDCDSVRKQLELYRKQSDSVAMFLDDEGYQKSSTEHLKLKEVYAKYKNYCIESGYKTCSNRTLSERLQNLGYDLERRNIGMVVFIEKVTEVTQVTL